MGKGGRFPRDLKASASLVFDPNDCLLFLSTRKKEEEKERGRFYLLLLVCLLEAFFRPQKSEKSKVKASFCRRSKQRFSAFLKGTTGAEVDLFISFLQLTLDKKRARARKRELREGCKKQTEGAELLLLQIKTSRIPVFISETQLPISWLNIIIWSSLC